MTRYQFFTVRLPFMKSVYWNPILQVQQPTLLFEDKSFSLPKAQICVLNTLVFPCSHNSSSVTSKYLVAASSITEVATPGSNKEMDLLLLEIGEFLCEYCSKKHTIHCWGQNNIVRCQKSQQKIRFEYINFSSPC